MSKKVLLSAIALLSIMAMACTSPSPSESPMSSTLAGEAAAGLILETIPEGWRLSRTLQSALPVFGFQHADSAEAYYLAIVEQDLCNDDKMDPVRAILQVKVQADKSIKAEPLTLLDRADQSAADSITLQLQQFETAENQFTLHFAGGNEWQKTAAYSFEFEKGSFYLVSAKTVAWHVSDPKAIDQQEYDFKDYYLRSTQINDCGDITCTEVQFKGDTEALRVKLQDFVQDGSLVRFADLL